MAIQGDGDGDGDETIWGKLHSELLILILLRLPVISILRFKSVCRDWYVLFNSKWFTQHHCSIANSSNETTNLLSLFIHSQKSEEGNGGIFSLVCERSCGKPVLEKLVNPFGGSVDDIQVVGSINGLVCLTLCNNATSIVLWNPATRKVSHIPNPQLLLGEDESVSVGFAYDEKTDSYKVIRILYPELYDLTMLPARVEAYSSVTNAWRTTLIANFPWLSGQKTCGAVVGGCPYWYAYESGEMKSSRRKFIMWFDASVKGFRIHPLKLEYVWYREIVLGAMGENPAAFIHPFEMGTGVTATSAWLWKVSKCDDGFSESFSVENSMTEHISGGLSVTGFRRNGEIIAFDEDGKLLVYGPHCAIKYLPSCGSWCSPKAYDYIETLVSPSRVD